MKKFKETKGEGQGEIALLVICFLIMLILFGTVILPLFNSTKDIGKARQTEINLLLEE